MIVLWCVLGIVVFYILLLIVSAMLVDTSREYTVDSPFYRFLLQSATDIMVVLLRIRIKTTGTDMLPKGRFLLVSNHRSNFDPILTWHVFKKHSMAFVSKKENFQIPVFGRIIRRCCFMAIDRENPRNAIKTVQQAADLIKSDEASVGIYPEGTRSKECVLLPFHASVFKIAQKAEVPIVVITVDGTENIHKNTPFHKTVVKVDVLRVITLEEIKGKRTVAISQDVSECMARHLNKTKD